jgi:hypothetical protein
MPPKKQQPEIPETSELNTADFEPADPDKLAQETSPIFDELVSAESADKTDVASALKRDTDDGPGDLDALPESDWISYETDDVEKEDG